MVATNKRMGGLKVCFVLFLLLYPPDFYPAYRCVKARIGQTPPIFPSLYAPIRGVKIRWFILYFSKTKTTEGGLQKKREKILKS